MKALLYNKSVEKHVEVVLHKVVFSSGASVILSIVSTQNEHSDLKWAVACGGRSHSPIVFFQDSENAYQEFKKRCGEMVIAGYEILSNDVYGSLKGYMIQKKEVPQKIKKRGYKIVQRPGQEATEWRQQVGIKVKTLRLQNERNGK